MSDHQHYSAEEALGELLLLALDGNISEQEFKHLQTLLLQDAGARAYYYEFLTLYAGFSPSGFRCILDYDETQTQADYFSLFDCLSEEENRAPAIEVPPEASEQELIKKVEPVQKEKLKPSKWSTATFFLSIAAILFLVVVIRFLPDRSGWEVATLTDTVNAKWADPAFKMENGVRLMTSDPPFMLREGYAELVFDNAVKVVIEAPAEFQLLADDQIKLNYGRVYSVVPEQADGFTVCTTESKVIDLGTEFGVQMSMYGNLEVHVIKGKANLLSSAGQKVNRQISAGYAGKLDEKTGQLEVLSCDDRLFARKIDSRNKFVWKGQDIDLADIVGGGNGLGSGLRGSHIDPSDGRWHRLSGLTGGLPEPGKKMSGNQYRPVRSNPFIDGVFVPNGQNGPVSISSAGHQFTEAPNTSGEYWYGVIHWDDGRGRMIDFDGTRYGTPEEPALLMHSNIGITFDLEAIRKYYPDDGSIAEFVSIYGVSEAYADKTVQPYADFWVLVDGQVRFSRQNMTIQRPDTVRVPLLPSDRFLTLVTTEGTENELSTHDEGPIFNDWCVWGKPILKIK